MAKRTKAKRGADEKPKRLTAGVPRLDYILKGGFFCGSTYVLMGPPGSGKTILANHIAYQHIAQAGGHCVYITLLVESHSKMMAHLASLEFYKPELVGKNIIYVSGYAALRDGGYQGLLELVRRTIREHDASILVMDGLESVHECAPRSWS